MVTQPPWHGSVQPAWEEGGPDRHTWSFLHPPDQPTTPQHQHVTTKHSKVQPVEYFDTAVSSLGDDRAPLPHLTPHLLTSSVASSALAGVRGHAQYDRRDAIVGK